MKTQYTISILVYRLTDLLSKLKVIGIFWHIYKNSLKTQDTFKYYFENDTRTTNTKDKSITATDSILAVKSIE